MQTIGYDFTCATCHKESTVLVEMPDNVYDKVVGGKMTLKEATTPGTFQREVFISGMCFDCQEKTFNRPAPGHEEDWGECRGECPVCGCPIYEKDVIADECPTCTCTLSEEMDDYDEDMEEDEEEE